MSKDFLEGLLGHIIEDIKKHEKKVDIGKISEELRKRYAQWSNDKDFLKKELETRKDILQAEIELQLYREFNVALREIDERKDELWAEIEKELGIEDGNRRLSIDMKTGMISDKVREDAPKEKPKDLGEAMYEALKKKNRVP